MEKEFMKCHMKAVETHVPRGIILELGLEGGDDFARLKGEGDYSWLRESRRQAGQVRAREAQPLCGLREAHFWRCGQ